MSRLGRASKFVFWMCHNKSGVREGVWGCTAAADKYAKERNTIFVKRTTDNLPLNRAWHFKQAKPTTERNEEEYEEWVLLVGRWGVAKQHVKKK